MGSSVKGQPSASAQKIPAAGPTRPAFNPQSAIGGSGAPASGAPSRTTPEIGRAVEEKTKRMAGQVPARFIATEQQQQAEAAKGRKAQFDAAQAERYKVDSAAHKAHFDAGQARR